LRTSASWKNDRHLRPATPGRYAKQFILASPLQPFRKWLGRVKLRIDDHLALFVDVAPLASALITNPHCREAIRKMECGIKLRLDDNTPGLFGDLCDGSMSVLRPDGEDS
jgi:hypothetical protein